MTKARDIADGAAGTVNLSGYATTNDLTNYALTTDLAGYATTSDLATKLDADSTLNPAKLDSTGSIPSALLAGVGGGKVLQVVTEKYTTNTELSSASFVEVFSKSITPTSDTSQILVLISGGRWALYSSPSYEAYYQVNRGSTELMTGLQTIRQVSGNIASGTISVSYLDNPASSSAVSYNIKAKTSDASKSVAVCDSSNPITMTLIEIAA